jgi:hypothetical protein
MIMKYRNQLVTMVCVYFSDVADEEEAGRG